MNTLKVVAIVLIIAGILGLAYGSFSYTRERTAMKVGPMELSVKEKKTVNVPIWAGVAALVAGGLMFAAGGRKG